MYRNKGVDLFSPELPYFSGIAVKGPLYVMTETQTGFVLLEKHFLSFFLFFMWFVVIEPKIRRMFSQAFLSDVVSKVGPKDLSI